MGIRLQIFWGIPMITFIKKNNGFTMIEILIVVAIIGILAAIAIPKYSTFMAKSRRAEGIQILQGFYTSEVAYYSTSDTYAIHRSNESESTHFPDNLEFELVGTPKYYLTNNNELEILPTDRDGSEFGISIIAADIDGRDDRHDWLCLSYPRGYSLAVPGKHCAPNLGEPSIDVSPAQIGFISDGTNVYDDILSNQ